MSDPKPWFVGRRIIFLLCTSDASRVRTLPNPPMPGHLTPCLSLANIFPGDWTLYPIYQPLASILHGIDQSPSTYPWTTFICAPPPWLNRLKYWQTERCHEGFRFQIQIVSAPLDTELLITKDPDERSYGEPVSFPCLIPEISGFSSFPVTAHLKVWNSQNCHSFWWKPYSLHPWIGKKNVFCVI